MLNKNYISRHFDLDSVQLLVAYRGILHGRVLLGREVEITWREPTKSFSWEPQFAQDTLNCLGSRSSQVSRSRKAMSDEINPR